MFVGAKRSPIGKLGGALSSKTAVQLGSQIIKAAMEQTTLAPDQVDEVFMGNVVTAGEGQNPARQAALNAGLPYSVPATTINDVCGSGMQAIRLAAQQIMLNTADVVVAGGMESMSNAPYLIPHARFGYKYGDGQFVDALYHDGLQDAYHGYPMGMTAENLLEKYPESREDIDAFALMSQEKAKSARDNGKFDDEIVPIEVTSRHKSLLIKQDEPIRETSMQQLAKLKPVFKEGGSVTAGNSSGLNDGAAAVVMTSGKYAEAHHLPILGYWSAGSIVGVDPAIMGIGPYYAIKKLMQEQSINDHDIDLYEINEAFAAQSLVVLHQLEINPDKVNVNGGAIALGHPIGASGARIIVTMLYEMNRRNAHTGVASLCIGGGMGAATLVTK